jgi:hypothetical protein
MVDGTEELIPAIPSPDSAAPPAERGLSFIREIETGRLFLLKATSLAFLALPFVVATGVAFVGALAARVTFFGSFVRIGSGVLGSRRGNGAEAAERDGRKDQFERFHNPEIACSFQLGCGVSL